MKVTVADARNAGVCKRMRGWFRKHRLDWDAFCGEGVELADLLATDDHSANVMKAAKQARKRNGLE